MFFPFSAMQVFNMLALLSLDYLHKRGILPLILLVQKFLLENNELSYGRDMYEKCALHQNNV